MNPSLLTSWRAAFLAVALPLSCSLAFGAGKLLVTNATVTTLEEDQPKPFIGYLLVGEDGRIAAIGEGTPPADTTALTTYDAHRKVIMPGFLSGHSHLWQSAYRGIAADKWVLAWVQQIHRTYGPFFQTGDLGAFTLHGALDYLRHGITTTYNYSQNLNFPPEQYEEQYEAEVAAGARFIFGYAITPRSPREVVRQNLESFLSRVASAPANPLLLKISLSSAGVDTSAEYTGFEFDLMRAHGLDMQMHYLESTDVQEKQRAAFPYIEEANGLTPKLVFAHFIQTDDAIIEKSGAAHVGMIWNPLSNGRLASGFADIPRYLKAGVRIGMGIDGQASADISDPFENMRMGLYQTRMRYESASILLPLDMLKLHTIRTAEVLGVEKDVGTLKVGKFADFLVVDPAEMDTGPVFDLYATLVFACSIANVERTYVGGEFLVERGKLLRQDFPSISRDVERRVSAVKARLAAAAAAKAKP